MLPRIAAIGVVAILAIALSACQGTDKPPQPRYVSDYRSSYVGEGPSAPQSSYFIEFRSRYALTYGHTYVIYGQLGPQGQILNQQVAGLSPASTDAAPYVIGHFVPVPAETGVTDGDLEEEYRSASWRVILSEPEYRKVVAYIDKLKGESKVWLASVSNCNNFVASIARSMGYKTPSIWLRPQQFITRLREMNGG